MERKRESRGRNIGQRRKKGIHKWRVKKDKANEKWQERVR
jgi:hypothetical protein